MATRNVPGERILGRAVAVLDCFRPEHPELGVREVARQLHMSSSTAGRILANLHALGILNQDPVSHRYMMGSRVLTWSSVYMSQLDVVTAARAALAELHRITSETVSVYLLEGTERICVERIESPERVRVVVRRGERMPLHAGSAGKAILAYADHELVEQVLSQPLERMTKNTIIKRKQLLQELATIRACGYAVSHSERFEDALGLAAPIFNGRGVVVAALNVAGPTTRFTDAEVAKFAPKIMQLGAQISQALGYHSSSS